MLETFGDKIRKIRTLKGLSQEFIALQLCISQKTYSNLENGKLKISWDRLQQIATVLNVDDKYIVNFSSERVLKMHTSANDEQNEKLWEFYTNLLEQRE